MKDIRTKAIAGLSKTKMDAVDQVLLARSYGVRDWLLEGYTTLVKREANLSSKEAERLGYETAFRLCQKREDTFKKYQQSLFGRHEFNTHREFGALRAEICNTFRKELIDAGHSGEVSNNRERLSSLLLRLPTGD
jgi:hypothetical protein